MDCQENKKRSFESKLDLDYDNFVTKKIERCNLCGDIFYMGIQPPHACGSAGASCPTYSPSAISVETTSQADDFMPDSSSNTNICQEECSTGSCDGTDRNLLCDKIYTIWEESGFKRYCMEDEEPKEREKEAVKDKFSFSPYDNFF